MYGNDQPMSLILGGLITQKTRKFFFLLLKISANSNKQKEERQTQQWLGQRRHFRIST